MKSKNENFVAFSFDRPENNPAEIVIPLRETPGNKARTWSRPMNMQFFQFSFDFLKFNFVSNKIKPVKKNARLMKSNDESAVSIMSLKKNPKRAEGIVAIIKNIKSLFCLNVASW
ncbi:MAG: hypothetical protein U9Q06_01080 [Nanoarchaeota archaeon]|nr:hypothetical protein [Nanoarchaeota archaeon]